jgi:STE24 endopeptidase
MNQNFTPTMLTYRSPNRLPSFHRPSSHSCGRHVRGLLYCLALGGSLCFGLPAAEAPQPARPAQPAAAAFNPQTATRAYLDRIAPSAKARSDAYFEGGYWVQLWQFLYGCAVGLLFLQTGLSPRMRNLAIRIGRFKPLQTAVYAVQYMVLAALLTFPLTVYTDFFREHHYGLATQAFGGWLGDWLKGLLVSVILGSLFFMALFGVVRRLERTWHLWGALVTLGFLVFALVISPVFIAPLFNQYTPLADPKVVDPILLLARANGIAADRVYEMDASKQSTRVSANVSGFLGTMRITLNDNLLKRCSPAEIQAVMAHEIGHYVLNHIFKMILFLGILIVAGFFLLRWGTTRLLHSFGSLWGICGIGDVAVMPLAVLLFSTYLFLLTPFTNSFIRMQEMEADRFGLNAARQPDGFAEVALKLGEYRKMEPGPIEEWIFFDHPSGATRIRTAMGWKAANLRQDSASLSAK